MMNKQMMNMEEPEQVNGGNPSDWQSPADSIVDGFIDVGKKVADGARWLLNGIKSLF